MTGPGKFRLEALKAGIAAGLDPAAPEEECEAALRDALVEAYNELHNWGKVAERFEVSGPTLWDWRGKLGITVNQEAV